jgi:hypothetical protein
MNLLDHNKKITTDWYNGTTGIYPIDILIDKLKNMQNIKNSENPKDALIT